MRTEAITSWPISEKDNGEGLITRVYPQVNLAAPLFPHISGFRLEMGDSNILVLRRRATGDGFVTSYNEDGEEILGRGIWDHTQAWVGFQEDHEVPSKAIFEVGDLPVHRIRVAASSPDALSSISPKDYVPAPDPAHMLFAYERGAIRDLRTHQVRHTPGYRDIFSVKVGTDLGMNKGVALTVFHGREKDTFKVGVRYVEEKVRFGANKDHEYNDCNTILTIGK